MLLQSSGGDGGVHSALQLDECIGLQENFNGRIEEGPLFQMGRWSSDQDILFRSLKELCVRKKCLGKNYVHASLKSPTMKRTQKYCLD